MVDLLIGQDQIDLHFSKCDIKGDPGEPVATLGPLGWSCIGHPHRRTTAKVIQTNLYWIRGKGKQYLPFVANRIGEIQSQSNPEQWQYVETEENPADLCSRGLSASRLKDNTLWWRGPDFLTKHESCLLYTSPSPRDLSTSRMPSSA